MEPRDGDSAGARLRVDATREQKKCQTINSRGQREGVNRAQHGGGDGKPACPALRRFRSMQRGDGDKRREGKEPKGRNAKDRERVRGKTAADRDKIGIHDRRLVGMGFELLGILPARRTSCQPG